METKAYDRVAEMPCYTVVNSYERLPDETGGAYESEATMEAGFIRTLAQQGYEYLPEVKSEEAFKGNLRRQMEWLNRAALNGGCFTDGEWQRFYDEVLAKKSDGIEEKTAKFQEERRFAFTFDDGRSDNLMIFDDQNINNNTLQVINQYREDNSANGKKVRYDVTVLVNGLPLVHVELKRRGVAIKEAFNQIARYSRDGFWGGDALFEWVQIFVISNGTHTKYYANTTRRGKVREAENAAASSGSRSHTSETFEFTSYWSDAKNNLIEDIRDFARTFFAQQTLRNILAKYCVFTVDRCLMVMRPYQIAATERIIEKIRYASGKKDVLGTRDAGGYVWHSTGSGKTLTSFKTAQLASKLDYVDKVLFVVDRQDLDDQTQREYDKFQKGCVAGTANTKALTAQLSDAVKSEKSKIVITTIQKLSIFVKENKPGSVHAGIYNRHVVIIFDECHRTQFGKMHHDIAKRFRRYQIFGFTGTPRFEGANEGQAMVPNGPTTTAQVFGERLHSYTMANAIRDKNVLPFHIETIGWAKPAEGELAGTSADERQPMTPEEMASVPRRPEQIEKIVAYVLSHYASKTLQTKAYMHKIERRKGAREDKGEKRLVSGFNSIFAVNFIDDAKAYYTEFKRQIAELPDGHPAKGLKIATIFTATPNEAETEGVIVDDNGWLIDDEGDPTALDATSKEFLEAAMADYNRLFPAQGATGFSAKDGDTFHNYYIDVSTKMKNRELDMLIVVNMFLTGFDAKTLNTLWLDKNLKLHSLVQAYSRTNRILNSIKQCGNIICFRDLENATNEAIALFSDSENGEDASEIIKIKTFDEYYSAGFNNAKGEHVKSYTELVSELQAKFPPDKEIEGNEAKEEYVQLLGEVLKRQNLLRIFDEYEDERETKQIISPLDMQDYISKYLDIRDEMANQPPSEQLPPQPSPGSEVNGDDEDADGDESEDADEGLEQGQDTGDGITFELELIRQFDVDFDYILMLIDDYHGADEAERKPILEKIVRAIRSSETLRPKKDLIMDFIERYDDSRKWQAFVRWRLDEDIRGISEGLGLDAAAVKEFIGNAIGTRRLMTVGPDFDKLIPPMDLFGGEEAARDAEEKRREVAAEMSNLYNRYKDDYSESEEA